MRSASRHPGDSTSSCLHGSLPTVLPENSVQGWGTQPGLSSPRRISCHCYADDFVAELSRLPRESFHQHLSYLVLSFASLISSAVIIERNALKYSPTETKQNASQTQPSACHVREGRGVKPKDMARDGKRDKQLISPGICLSICPSIYGHILAIQVEVCADMGPR